MQPSIIGLAVAMTLVVLDRALDGRLLVGLLVSLTFGATAFAALPALGGSSPLIYTLFALAMAIKLAASRSFFSTMVRIFKLHPIAWCILLMTIYGLVGAVILPRLFQGVTIVYVVERGASGTGGVVPVRLSPSTFNVSQAGYFALAAACYFTVLGVAIENGGLKRIKVAAFAWVVFVAATGYIDLLGKFAGLGDLFEPIRTANYTMMTGEQIAGFARISGAFPEASAFASVSLPACAFAFSYWWVCKHPAMLLLGVLLLLLVLLSTSSTSYVALVICVAALCLGSIKRLLLGRVATADLILVGLGACSLSLLLGAYLADETLFSPFFRMIEIMVLNKSTSSSALERGAWNVQALQAFLDTLGLGVGIGSTRTSSWIVAVISHLGFLGAATMFAITSMLLRNVRRGPVTRENRSMVALATGCRASALAGLVSTALVSDSADPGIMFYFAIAAIVAITRELEKMTIAPQDRKPQDRSMAQGPAAGASA
ncbi:MAG: hypothetical protein R3D67_08615 [Hyphomicrobiaceae bacterium]